MPNASPFPADLYRRLPKAELHLHLEGTIGPSEVLALCRAKGVDPPAQDEAGIKAWFDYGGFDDFLARYFFICRLLREPRDFRDVALRYLREAHAQGAVHVEFHVSSSIHCLMNHTPWESILEGTNRACDDAERELGVTSAIIPDLSPKFGFEPCRSVLDAIIAQKTDRVAAVGLVGPTEAWKEEDYGALARKAREAGLAVVAHAGEHGGAWEVQHALDHFGVSRVQHGITAGTEPALLERLRDEDIPCDMCLASNVNLKATETYAGHPIRAFAEAGAPVTLSSDDPPMVHSTLLDEYRLAWEEVGLRNGALLEIAQASLHHAFAPEETKARWLADFDRIANDSGATNEENPV